MPARTRGHGRSSNQALRARRLISLATAAATALAGVGLAAATPAAAATAACTITFVGASGGAWSTAANWSPQAVPGSTGRTGDRVCIPSGTTVTHDSGDYTVAGFNTDGSTPGGLVGTIGNITIAATGGVASRLGSVTLDRTNLYLDSGAVLTTGDLTIQKSAVHAGAGMLSGLGAVTVDGDLTVRGGQMQTSNTTVTQTAGHTLSISSDPGTGAVADIRSTTISSSSPAAVTGGVFLFAATVITSDQLTLAGDAAVTGGGRLQARGVTTTDGTPSVAMELRLTGATSSLGADLTVGGLGATAGGSLTIGAGRQLTISQGINSIATTIAGTVTGSGTLRVASSGGSPTFAPGSGLTVASLSLDGGTTTTEAGSTVSLGTFTAHRGTWTNSTAAVIGSGGFNLLGRDDPYVGNYAGAATGSITVDGDVLVSGGFISTANQVWTQTPGHAATFESRQVSGPGGTYTHTPRLQSTKLTTPNAVSLKGNVNFVSGRITTLADLEIASGATFSPYSGATLEARGIVASTDVGLGDASLKLTGTTSALGGDLTLSTLQLTAGSRLLIPADGLLTTIGAGSVTVPEGATFGGSGTVVGLLTNNGTVSPGDTPAGPGTGTLTTNRYQQGSTGVLDIDVAEGANDQLAATNTEFGNRPSLAGSLTISRLGGYTPPVGTALTVLTSGYAPSLAGLTTTDDLPDGKFGPPSVVGNAVVVSRGPLTTTAPGAPSLSLAAGVESIAATVGAPASDGGSPVTAYVVTCSPSCGTNEVAAPGVVQLNGLQAGVAYTVSAFAINAVGTSAPATAQSTPLAASSTAAPSTTKLVLKNTATSGSFTVTCARNAGQIKACGVVVKSAGGTVLAKGGPVSIPAGATSIPVTVRLTSAGLSASKAFGGVRGTVTSTLTHLDGTTSKATSKVQLVRATTKKQILVGKMFTTGGTLTSSGKTLLVAVAKQAAGGKVLRCDGHWSTNVGTATAYSLALDRAKKACAYVKATITRLGLKPIGKYVPYSYGRSKQVKGTAAQNRRIVFTLTS